LPLSERHALVEVTQFDPVPLPPETLKAALEAAIAKRLQDKSFDILRSEHGILPMGSRPGRTQEIAKDPSYVHAGLMRGGARPATGYAFQRLQQWAASCAGQIGKGQLPLGHRPDPLVLRAMDHLFLSVLRSHPALAPQLFLRLFSQVDSASLIRFLSERATIADYAAIVAALPAAPFLRQIPAALRRITKHYLSALAP
jgi:lycopene beta-cyclase